MKLREIILMILMIGSFVGFFMLDNFFYGWIYSAFFCVYVFWEYKTEYIAMSNIISALKLVKDDRPLKERFGYITRIFRRGK